MSKLVTNFGDMVTTGNTTLQQNLFVQGAYSSFSGNLLAGTSYSTVGNVTTKFNSVFAGSANVTTANVTSIYGPAFLVGIGNATPSSNLHVQGNVFASNALVTPVVFASTSLNAATSNILGIFGPVGLTGVGTLTPGSTLHVVGNVYASNALSAPNVFASTSLNAATSNILGIFGPAGLTGVGTLTPGSTLHVAGNVYASNALSAPVVFASTSLNAATANILGIFGPAGLTGVGTLTPGSTLHVQGNIYASNALSTPNIFATVSVNVGSVANVTNIYGTSGVVGIGTVPTVGGATLQIGGNLFASNALSAPNVFATVSMNAATSNILGIFGPAGLTGVGTLTPGSTLHVAGNIYASNALSTPNIFALTSMNVGSIANVTNIYGTSGVVGIGTVPTVGGATLQIGGNLFASNALSAPNVFGTVSVNAAVMNTTAIFAASGFSVGIGTSTNLGANLQILGNLFASNAVTAPVGNATSVTVGTTLTTLSIWGPAGLLGVGTATPGANLHVQGNVYASNALSAPVVSAQTSLNAAVANVTSIFGPSGLTGVGTLAPTATLDVAGNVNVSNTIFVSNIRASTMNVTTMNVTAFYGTQSVVGVGQTPVVGGATLQVNGNLYASNSVQTTNIIAAVMNVPTINTTSIYSPAGLLGIGTAVPTATLHVQGNVYVSNAIQTPNVFTAVMNVSGTTNTASIYSPTGLLGIGTATAGATLQVQGNVYVSNAIQTPNVFTAVMNVSGTTNTASIYSPSGLLGIGTATAGATLQVQGNVYVSNAIQTPNIFATTMNVPTMNVTSLFGTTNGLVGVGTGVPNANLHVIGNIYASNSVQTTNVYATGTANVPVLNVLSIYGQSGLVGIGTATPGSTLHVQGNIYASNGITAANYFVTSANIATINVGNITGTASLVTFQSNLLIQGGNLAATGNLTAQNVFTTNLSYGVDLVKQAAWIRPSATNSIAIQNWIGSVSNATTGSWWSQSARPVYGNVSIVATPGYSNSGVLLPDGRVMFTPSATGNVGYWNPSTGLYSVSATKVPAGGFSVVVPSGNVVIVGSSNISALNPLSGAFSNLVAHGNVFAGATLDPYGNVVGIPAGTGNLISFSPTTSTFTNVSVNLGGPATLNFSGGLLLPNGNVVCVPLTNSNAVQYNPVTGAVANTPFGLETNSKFSGAVLTPNGNVVFVPVSSNVGIWNPSVGTFSNVPTGAGASSFRGGVLLPNGNVVLVPQTSANVGLVNGTTRAYSNATGTSGGFSGGVLVPDGRVVFVPSTSANVGVLDTMTPAPVEFCTGPYFNKF